jgi:DUF4097 and DUF4098 domain-containing protein YvlB
VVGGNAEPPEGVNPVMRFTSAGLSILFAAGSLAGCTVTVDSQSQIVREEKHFTVQGIPDIRVTTFDGAINVQSWDKPDVMIEIEKRGPTRESIDTLEIKSSQLGNVIELEVKKPRTETLTGIGFYRSPSARLIVTLPRRADVRARSGDGSIHVERVEGKLELRTGDGSINASEVAGELTLNTSDGSVRVEDAKGTLVLDTGDGSVDVSGTLSSVRVHTGDGAIIFHARPGTTMTSDWEITTGDGGVSLYLPDTFNAELDAHTGDGTIVKSDLRIATTDGESGRRSVKGRIGTGGKLLRIRTTDGSIRLRAF